jgi:hypothetical protein
MTTVQPGVPRSASAPVQRDLPPDAWIDGHAPTSAPAQSTDRTAEYLSALVLSHTRAVKLTRERFLELIASTRDATEIVRQLVGMFDDSQDG